MKISPVFSPSIRIIFVVLLFSSTHIAFGQGCNCPPVNSCSPCAGDLISLTLQYNGPLAVSISASDNGGTLYAALLVSPGEVFTVTGSLPNNRFAGNILNVYVNLGLDFATLTTCPAGLEVGEILGSFTIVGAASRTGGPLCCSPGGTETNPPTISNCPSNISVNLLSGCSRAVGWPVPNASDNCGAASLTSTHTPGTSFPAGTTTVTYTATDDYGNTANCSFTVTVNDNIDPVITGCPSNISIFANTACEAAVNWTAPTATDNCSLSTFTSNKVPGATFPIGVTTVTYTATDASGNTSLCSFTVTVSDNTNPVITGCPSNIVAPANGLCQASVPWTAPTATDNCGTVTLVSTHTPGATFPLGTTQVKYTATDAKGNSSVCTFNVTVQDNAAPIITGCPSTDIIVNANASCQAVATWSVPTASDNCGGLTLASTHSPGNLFNIGTTQVKYTATDAALNSSVCTFNVIVKDVTNPVLTGCPSNITLNANASCQAIATWTPPTATDNCGVPVLTSTHASGTAFPKGTTQVKYTATDAAGNTSVCTFNVIVNDITNPLISGCPANIAVFANASCQATVNWTAPTATDNCTTVTLTTTRAPGSTFALGTTQVKYTATDGSGNTATCTFNVTVTDNTNPVIANCPSNITVPANGACKATVNWTAPTATDNCGVPTLTTTHTPGSLFSLGTTQVKYAAKDATGNTSICTFNVIVIDNTKPIIAGCPSSDIILSANSSCQAAATWSAITATDNCTGVTLAKTHSSGAIFSLGTTVVTYTAKDAAGNITTCSFNVVVQDNTNPTFTGCIGTDIQAVAIAASCDAVVNWTPPVGTENCGAVAVTSSHNPGDHFPIGTTVVTYTATNSSGGTETCSFNVVVKDELAPVITGCSTIHAVAQGSCETTVNWAVPAATDCGTVTLTSSHQPGDVFPLGETEVTYSATDNAGNASTCNFIVVVEDKTAPVFENCSAKVSAIAQSSCSTKVSWTEPTITDNCNKVTVARSHAPGDEFLIGTTTVVYTATDAAGNTSTCQFSVSVTTDAAPTIASCPADIVVESNENGEAIISWTEPTAATICGSVAVTGSHSPGDRFPIGTTVVTYTATGDQGQAVTCSFNVNVSQSNINIDISKVITPDGNGQNDEWVVTNIEKFRDNKVVIVDRWGSVIYSAAGYDNQNIVWRGSTSGGSLAPTGTYFYTFSIRYGQAAIEKTGFIELIR